MNHTLTTFPIMHLPPLPLQPLFSSIPTTYTHTHLVLFTPTTHPTHPPHPPQAEASSRGQDLSLLTQLVRMRLPPALQQRCVALEDEANAARALAGAAARSPAATPEQVGGEGGRGGGRGGEV
jgi:hypothetical protein